MREEEKIDDDVVREGLNHQLLIEDIKGEITYNDMMRTLQIFNLGE